MAAAGACAGRQEDLPVPAWLFAWGASIVLIVSFFALAAAWRKPRFERQHWRALGAGFSRAVVSMPVQVLCGLIGVFLLGVGIYAGLRGTEAPDRNFALTFFFVTVWLGFPFFSAIFGDLFRPFNPWRAIGRVAGGAFGLIAGQRPAHLAYPERLGRWPAAVGLIAVVWLEIVYGSSGGVAVGLDPHAAGVAAVVYSGYTLAMMAVFGVEKWCERGEVFSVYFGMFSRLGAFGVQDGRLGRRRMLSASTTWATLPGSAALVIASIATTSFDGASEGAFKSAIETVFDWLEDVGFDPNTALRLTDTALHPALLRRRRPRLPARCPRHAHGPRRPFVGQAARRLRPHADPDRARLPRRPLLQPLRLPGAGAVRLPALRPARKRHDRPLRHRRVGHRLHDRQR